jgi:hypothetical protein
MKYQTIQKVANDMGVAPSYIRNMIKNKDLKVYKINGYKRLYIDIDELYSLVNKTDKNPSNINLDGFLI